MTKVKSPVLLLGYNRPALFQGLVQRVRVAKPEQVFVSIDGPRHASDRSLVDQTREVVGQIDWTSDVHLRFADHNLGCRVAVSSAISWMFDHVPIGVILEDDVRPSAAFFEFADVMLDRFQYDERVATVSGVNRVPPRYQGSAESAYRFSRYAHIWGWATWGRTWNLYKADIHDWHRQLPFTRLQQELDGSFLQAMAWRRIFNGVATGRVDTWDAQLQFMMFSHGKLSISPNRSLVENVGFGEYATHTKRRPEYLESASAQVPDLTVPVAIERDPVSDAWEAAHLYQGSLRGLARGGWHRLRRELERRSARR